MTQPENGEIQDDIDRLDYMDPKNPVRDLDARSTAPDFDAISRALGEPELPTTMPEDEKHRASFVIKKMLEWLLDVDLKRKSSIGLVGKRAIAFAWTVDPTLFDKSVARKKATSLRRLALQLGLPTPAISKVSAAASRHFGITNQFQKHDWKNHKN